MFQEKIKNRIAFIFTVLGLFMIITALALFAINALHESIRFLKETPFLVKIYGPHIYLISLLLIIAAIFVLRISSKIFEETRNILDHDEFGLNKKRTRDKLSKEEKNALDLQKMMDMERIISKASIKKITKQGSKDPKKDLDKLIGIIPVKQKINEMAARMQFDKKMKKNDFSESRHMVFLGAPGTGKTSVARIITGFLYKNGNIKENKIIEIDGNFLKSGSAGDSAIKTKYVIRQAYGGVLFIDEAYSLTEDRDPRGFEVVSTLLKEMEDNRDKFILIMAGYTENMKRMLSTNPGFESRIRDYIMFPDYTTEELKQIFIAMANENNLVVSPEALDNFEIRINKEKHSRSYGNARTVRTILDKAIDKHSYNYMKKIIKDKDKYRLTQEDVETDRSTIL